jgi:hypothetical protein
LSSNLSRVKQHVSNTPSLDSNRTPPRLPHCTLTPRQRPQSCLT